jgi:hypothetical protein
VARRALLPSVLQGLVDAAERHTVGRSMRSGLHALLLPLPVPQCGPVERRWEGGGPAGQPGDPGLPAGSGLCMTELQQRQRLMEVGPSRCPAASLLLLLAHEVAQAAHMDCVPPCLPLLSTALLRHAAVRL